MAQGVVTEININGKSAVIFIQKNNKIFYIIFSEFKNEMEKLEKMILNFFSDNLKNYFTEINTNIPKEEYKNIIKHGIFLFYHGDIGYYYSVYKYNGVE